MLKIILFGLIVIAYASKAKGQENYQDSIRVYLDKNNCEKARFWYERQITAFPGSKLCDEMIHFKKRIERCNNNKPEKRNIVKNDRSKPLPTAIDFISGRVIAGNGEPIEDALVFFSNLGMSAYTDDLGCFKFKNKGITNLQKISLKIFKTGYNDYSDDVGFHSNGAIIDEIVLKTNEKNSFYIQLIDSVSNDKIDNAEIYCDIGKPEKIDNMPGFYRVDVNSPQKRFLVNVHKEGYRKYIKYDIFLDRVENSILEIKLTRNDKVSHDPDSGKSIHDLPQPTHNTISPWLPLGIPQYHYEKIGSGIIFTIFQGGFIGGSIYCFSEQGKYKRYMNKTQNEYKRKDYIRKKDNYMWGGVACLFGSAAAYITNVVFSKKDAKIRNFGLAPYSTLECTGLALTIIL